MKKTIAIFGGGPAALGLASFLDPDLFDVSIFEQNKTCGRKFLVAGKGGFNLTHSEVMDQFIQKYIPSDFLEDALNHFSNIDLRNWLARLGIETFIGSSKRVFPVKGVKPIQVLEAILNNLEKRSVDINYQMKWDGWAESGLPLVNTNQEIKADYYIYAFGGGSWKITGSTGDWTEHFRAKEIGINDFEPSNCAFEVDWPSALLESTEGKALKNIAVTCGEKTQKGEMVITQFGLEGNAIYALSDPIRKQLQVAENALITIDFKPMFSIEDIELKLSNSKSKNNTAFLRDDLNLNKVQVQMIKHLTSKADFLDSDILIGLIKKLPITIVGMAPMDEAISTIGGVRREELTASFELKKMKHSFCIGEMVDWDAPTGGYLLQGCFSMGAFLADYLNKRR